MRYPVSSSTFTMRGIIRARAIWFVPYRRDSIANSGRPSALSRAARWLAQVLQPSSMTFLTVRDLLRMNQFGNARILKVAYFLGSAL